MNNYIEQQFSGHIKDKNTVNKFSAWPYVIVLSFIMLATFDAFIIYKAVSTGSGTLSDSPYEDGLRYEETVKAKSAALTDNLKLNFKYQNSTLEVRISGDKQPGKATLNLSLLKPDNPKLDKAFNLTSANAIFSIEDTQLERGLWLLKAWLESENKGFKKYYFEDKIFIR